MTPFNHLMKLLRKKESFHIARYNDGEWIWMLKIPPFYMRYLVSYKGDRAEVDKISSKLLGIIDSCPDYYIGVEPTVRIGCGIVASKKETIDAKLAKLQHLTYGDIFNAATVKLGIKDVITVGPEYMTKLGISDHHIIVPPKSCWVVADEIQQKLKAHLDTHIDLHPVVLYSCSLLAKLLIDINYHDFKDKLTQLDLGSCIDPWCGISSRPWHRFLI